MKLRHIYITKEGEPMGIDPNCTSSKFNDSLLPFEDREEVKDELFHQVTGGPQVDVPFNVMFKPDTLIPVDIEVEVVEQKIAAHENSDKSWGPIVLEGHKLFQYRKVLRIKN